MAKGPDVDVMAGRIVVAAQAALPQGDIGARDLRAAAGEFQRALELSPRNAAALEALAALEERIAGLADAAIARREFERAQALIEAANDVWPDIELFGDGGELRSTLDTAVREEEIRREVSDLILAAEEALSGTEQGGESSGPRRSDDIEAALRQLRQALDLDPDNERAGTIRDDVRHNLLSATRAEIDARNPTRAQRLLDVARSEWRGDASIAELSSELEGLLEELATTAELAHMVELGEARLAADSLTTPAGDSAADYFRRALELAPGNARAEAGLSRIAERYTALIGDAVARGDFGQARGLLSRFIEVAPGHVEIGPLQAQIESVEAAARAEREREADLASAADPESAGPTPVIADDEEGLLWSTVMNECDEAQLRRYIDAYPAGRYIEEAWRRRSACLEARR